MRAIELMEQSTNKPCIVVDVQPDYVNDRYDIDSLMSFLNKQNGPILMYVNTEETGVSLYSKEEIIEFWESAGFDKTKWPNVQIVDKGYGYLRPWMDYGVPESNIIKTLRMMYQEKVETSDELYGGFEDPNFKKDMEDNLGIPADIVDDALIINWISIAQLKKFNGSYIMGGGQDECLKEVQLLMNAFNIKYKEVRKFIY